jgi:hypothetical protein
MLKAVPPPPPAGGYSKGGSRTIQYVIVAVIIFAIIIILVVPFIPVRESYSEMEPYERAATYEVVSATLTQGFDLKRGIYHTLTVVVKNTDTKGGTFTVILRLYDVNGLFGEKTVSNYIAPGSSATFKAEFDTQLGQDVRGDYELSPPIVIDQRLVTKQRTVYKSIFEILIYGR